MPCLWVSCVPFGLRLNIFFADSDSVPGAARNPKTTTDEKLTRRPRRDLCALRSVLNPFRPSRERHLVDVPSTHHVRSGSLRSASYSLTLPRPRARAHPPTRSPRPHPRTLPTPPPSVDSGARLQHVRRESRLGETERHGRRRVRHLCGKCGKGRGEAPVPHTRRNHISSAPRGDVPRRVAVRCVGALRRHTSRLST